MKSKFPFDIELEKFSRLFIHGRCKNRRLRRLFISLQNFITRNLHQRLYIVPANINVKVRESEGAHHTLLASQAGVKRSSVVVGITSKVENNKLVDRS